MTSVQIRIFAVGIDRALLAPVEKLISTYQVSFFKPNAKALMKPVSPPPSFILVGEQDLKISLEEVAQLLRMVYPQVPIYLLCSNRQDFDRKRLIKDGFTDVFLMPVDNELFKNAVIQSSAEASKGSIKSYHPVKLIDLQAGEILDFDTYLYLSHNKQYIKFSAAGQPIDQSRVQKLIEHDFGTVYVESSKVQEFYQYALKRLNKSGAQPLLLITKRKADLKIAVRNFLSGLFRIPEVEDSTESSWELRKIIYSNVMQSGISEWYLPLLNWVGEEYDVYQHTSNVTLYSVLFGSQLGIVETEDLAQAALLHDVGIANMTRNSEQYKNHPELSLKLLKNRKMEISPITSQIILQHHERFDGSGYPKGLKGEQIHLGARILGIVDEIDYRIGIKAGKPQIAPSDALRMLLKECVDGKPHFDRKLVQQMLELFPK